MPRTDPKIATPALILKPLTLVSEGVANCFLGGLPRMPDGMEWPTLVRDRNRGGGPKYKEPINDPHHFLGQIDLGALPRTFDVTGLNFSIPGLPQSGTLYIFWNVSADDTRACVLYSPLTGAELKEREPPENLQNLREDEDTALVQMDGLSPCGRILKQRAFTVVPYLTSQLDQEDWEDTILGSNDHPEELLDALYDASLAEVLGTSDKPHVRYAYPWLPMLDEVASEATKTRNVLERLSSLFATRTITAVDGLGIVTGVYTVPESFPWRWSVIRAIAERLTTSSTLNDDHIRRFYDVVPLLLQVWADVPDEASKWLARCPKEDAQVSPSDAAEFRGWLRWVSTAADRVKTRRRVDPALIETCSALIEDLNKAKPHMVATTDYSEDPPKLVKTAACKIVEQLIPLMQCVEKYIPDKSDRQPLSEGSKLYSYKLPAPYFLKEDVGPTVAAELRRILHDVLVSFTERLEFLEVSDDLPSSLLRLASIEVERQTSISPDQVKYGFHFYPIQMFGTPYRGSGPTDLRDHVLLFQLGEDFGLPVLLHGYAMQLCITQEDLAQLNFDKVVTSISNQ